MARCGPGDGARHLAVLAREPRPAGGAAEGRARDYADQVLRGAGFDVRREPFEYSTFPGRYATPIGGALVAVTIACAAWLAVSRRRPDEALATLIAGTALVATFARAMLGDAVLTLPIGRASSENLVATRGVQGRPRVWLVAHLDSKSQPVPSIARVIGVVLLIVALVLAAGASVMQLAGGPGRTLWWAALLFTVLGAPAVIASVVGARSNGAVDNASGVAAVLSAAASLRPDIRVGVLLPSAEELGLAGARAWARGAPAGLALNCDGVDDEGEVTIMHRGRPPEELVRALQGAAMAPLRVRRMPIGLLTDSVALADRGWHAVTVSRGSPATLRRVHTSADSLTSLRGDGIDEVANLLARTAEGLA
ncbi:MAG TPA: M28 family peptidase [Gemmatimonadaceae bacterium]